ncbi:TPA: transcriptional regulator FeaR, partial [Klebsiella pneumoniae]
SGHSRISQDGQSIDLAPGELLLMDSVGSCEITPLGLIEHVSLPLSRQAVIQTVGSKAFGKVSATQGCGRMLQLMVDQVCRDESTAGDDSEALQHALISLLPAALQAEPVSNARPDGLSGSTLRRYVQSLIDDSLGQPGLTPASLAERLNISVRHLYRLFEEEGDSVCRYIQRARLQRSADDLLNPLLRNESITAIAYKWGFTDSAHFSRAFKKQFDRSPKAYRSGMQA